jgi:hypothetical protein
MILQYLKNCKYNFLFQSFIDIRGNIRIIFDKMGKIISQKSFSVNLGEVVSLHRHQLALVGVGWRWLALVGVGWHRLATVVAGGAFHFIASRLLASFFVSQKGIKYQGR